MFTFDCHVHPWVATDHIMRTMRAAGVDRICLFSIGNDGGLSAGSSSLSNPSPLQVGDGNNSVFTAMREYPEEITGFCFLNPRHRSQCLEEAQRCISMGMAGIKLWTSVKCSDEQALEVGAIAARLRVPLLVHCWNKVTGNYPNESTTEDVAILARAFPSLPIIAAHLTGQQERGIAELASCDNVYLDTSGADAEAGLIEFACREVGADRLLFGSDFPARGYASSLGRIFGAAITDEEKGKILGLNFCKLLENHDAAIQTV